MRLEHDPELAMAVYYSVRDPNYYTYKGYSMWLQNIVKPLAEAVGLELVTGRGNQARKTGNKEQAMADAGAEETEERDERAPRMRVVSFKLDVDLLEVLEQYARRKNISKSEVIRRAIRYYLDSMNDDKPYITRRIRVY